MRIAKEFCMKSKIALNAESYETKKRTALFYTIVSPNIQRITLILLLSIFPFMISCAPMNRLGEQIQTFYWDIQKKMRKPGEKMITHPNKVWEKYNCAQKKLPMLIVEANEILPPQLYSGKELNHHFIYSMCPAKPSQLINGTLVRRVYFKTRTVFEDVTNDFEFKPGEWSVDAFIGIPSKAPPGVYALEVSFSGGEHSFSKSEQFVVKPPK